MIKNYFKIAWRNLRNNKVYALINITGLTIGILSCLMIGIYIAHELSYDRFHKNAANIVRVVMEYSFGGNAQKVAVTGTKVGPQFKRTFPKVADFVRLEKRNAVVSYNGLIFKEKNLLYAEPSFLNVFSFDLIDGNRSTALNDPAKIIITQATAKKYFNTEDAIGKILKVDNKNYMVSAIAADVPANSQIQFDFVLPFVNLRQAKLPETYSEANFITYLLLKDNTDLSQLQGQISAYMKTVNGMDHKTGESLKFFIEPFTAVHLHSTIPDGLEPGGSIAYIYILTAVAILILIIACVNYVNLSVAQSARRGAEIGIRKVMGAASFQLFRQFIGESVFITAISVVAAYGVAFLSLGFFNQLSGKQLDHTVLFNPVIVGSLVLLGLIIGFAAGAYPALLLSNVKVIKILKSGFSFTSGKDVRGSLIVFQFVISIFLIVTTVIVLQQLAYIHNKDIGYNKTNVVVLPVDYTINSKIPELKKAIAALPGVVSVASANNEPVDVKWGDAIQTTEGKSLTVNALPMDEDFIKTMQLKVVAGSAFDHEDVLQTDTTNNYKNFKSSFMLNEAAVRALGWTPEQAVGKLISKNFPGRIKGVVKDFNFKSFHDPIGPLLLFLDYDQTGALFVRVTGTNTEPNIKSMATIWKERIPSTPFEYKFLDDDYDALYRTEQRTAGLFTIFSVLAILLACMGLFAITAYAVVQRTKEIGIRKVLGSSVSGIIMLISKDFLGMIIIASVIASPIAFYVCRQWLQDFAYRITIHWWIFPAAGAASLVVAGITVSAQAIKAALTTPVKSLRSE